MVVLKGLEGIRAPGSEHWCPECTFSLHGVFSFSLQKFDSLFITKTAGFFRKKRRKATHFLRKNRLMLYRQYARKII